VSRATRAWQISGIRITRASSPEQVGKKRGGNRKRKDTGTFRYGSGMLIPDPVFLLFRIPDPAEQNRERGKFFGPTIFCCQKFKIILRFWKGLKKFEPSEKEF
jgi:hypothetical protein